MEKTTDNTISTDLEDRVQFITTTLSSVPLIGGFISASANLAIKKRQDKRLSDFLAKLNDNTECCEYKESIPTNHHFLGRDEDIKNINDSGSRVIVIEGIPGVGKTYLGTELAKQHNLEGKVFWYTINEIDSAKTILCQLSSFLHQNNFSKAHGLLCKGNSDLNFLSDIIIEELDKDSFVLFFDDYHTLKDSQAKAIFEKLKRNLRKSIFVVITRPSPFCKFYTEHDLSSDNIFHVSLKGLNYDSSRKKLSNLGCNVNENTLLKIYDLTEGHPIALELISLYDKNVYDLESLFSQSPILPDNLVSYLFNEIFLGLSTEEKQVLKALSVYRTAVNIDAIKAHGLSNAIETSFKLSGKHLIEKNGKLYSSHPIIKNLSYSLIENKASYHDFAAEYYLSKKVVQTNEIIELQYHLLNAGDDLNSALITLHTSELLLRQGYVTPLFELLQLYKQETLPPEVWIFIGTILGKIYVIKHDLDSAESKFTEMLDLSYKLDYDNGVSSLLNNLSLIYLNKGDVTKSLDFQLKSLSLYEPQDDIKGKISCLINIGSVYLEIGEVDKSFMYANEALSEIESVNFPDIELVLFNLLGLIYRAYEDWDKAMSMFAKCKNIAVEIGDYSGIANASANLGNIYADRGQLEKAEKEYRQEIKAAKQSEEVLSIEAAYENFATLLADKKEYDKSNKCYNQVLDLCWQHGLVQNAATIYSNISSNFINKGDYDLALHNCKLAIKYAKKTAFKDNLANCLLNLGEIQEKRCNHKNVLVLYNKSISLCEETKNNYTKAFAYNKLGIFYNNKNDFDEAIKYFNLSLDLFSKFNSTTHCLMVCQNCIMIYDKLEDYNNTIKLYERMVVYLLDLNDKKKLSSTYMELIPKKYQQHNWLDLEKLCNDKINLGRELSEKMDLASTYGFLALALKYTKKYTESVAAHKEAISIAKEINDFELMAMFINDMGTTNLIIGNPKEAEANYLQSIEIKESNGNEVGIIRTYYNLGILYASMGDLQKGLEYLEKADDFYYQRGDFDKADQVFSTIITITYTNPKDIIDSLIIKPF
ncbi:tetratricopeptide repeat protein [Methanolobus sp. ZRKC5]|uniref:tetratricopeptide repeat protein n=1 Tax=unclassified Methanolobus TaxID=2629569 RepID=UPI00313ABAF3